MIAPNLPVNFKFTIKEAPSALQPKIDPNAFKFEQINDHCLLHIASYLDVVDIINLGKTSTRLQSFTQLIYQKETHFTFGAGTGDASINESNVEAVLQECGNYIQSIEWTNLESNQFDYLSKHCSNVTELKLIHPSHRLHLPAIKKNKHFFKNIEMLDISRSSFFDGTLQPITSSSQIKSLRLEHCSNICGKFFSKWKKPKLKYLTLINCRKIHCDDVLNFVQKNKLVRLSFDGRLILQPDLSLSSECVSELEELELNYSLFAGDKVEILNFGDLKQVTHFALLSNDPTCHNVNKILDAVSQIPTLRSLTVQQMNINIDTLNCLGSFKSLRKIHFDGLSNGIGKQFYSSLHVRLPAITELIISRHIYAADSAESKWICEMIPTLDALKTFSYTALNWELLFMILVEQLRLKRPAIEIKVAKYLFDDPKKVSAMFYYFHLSDLENYFIAVQCVCSV